MRRVVTILALAFPLWANAATVSWTAGSELAPDAIATPYTRVQNGSATTTLAGGELTILTSTTGGNSVFYRQDDPDVAFSGAHEITFRMLVDSSAATQDNRTAAGVTFTTVADVGQSLFIGNGELFLISATGTGVGDFDDTSLFHDYRIEIAGTSVGSTVLVYVDAVLVLSDSLFFSTGNFGSSQRVLFGEFSSAAFGDHSLCGTTS